MDNQNTFKEIKKLYKKLTYFDSYGSDVVITILIIVIFFLLISWYFVLNNIEPIKNDWINQRCRPAIMPFVSMINPPNDGRTNFQFTADNFTGCTQNIVKDIISHITKPIEYSINLVSKFFLMLIEALDKIRSMLTKMRDNMTAFGKTIFARILNITVGVQEFFIYLREMINKIQGIFISGFYVALGGYYTLKSTIGALFEIIVIILFVLLGVIIPLWIFPFTWAFAASMTAIFVAIAIPLSIIAIAMNSALGTTLSGVPSKPSCFEENTIITMCDGTKQRLKDIQVGDRLENNNIVTAKMDMSSKYESLYKLDDVYVSGNHKVYFKNKLIFVKDHPNAATTYKETFRLICLCVANKCIKINNTIFSDYDDLDSDKTHELYDNARANIANNRNISSVNFVHKYYQGGFTRNARIKLSNGTFKTIDDIKPDDMLDGRNRVLGCVEILNRDLFHKLKHVESIDNQQYYVSENVCVTYLGNLYPNRDCSVETPDITIVNTKVRLFHLITTQGFFMVGNMMFKDYDYLIDSNLAKTE